MDTRPQPTRRGFLDRILAFFSALTGLAMLIPGLMYLWPAAKGGAAASAKVGGANTMTPGQSVTLQVAGRPVIVVRGRSGFRAFSASCTHLGCLVKWDSSQKQFTCPCHAGVFDANGRVVSGPPPAPLPPYTIKEVGGNVFVSAKA